MVCTNISSRSIYVYFIKHQIPVFTTPAINIRNTNYFDKVTNYFDKVTSRIKKSSLLVQIIIQNNLSDDFNSSD